MRLHSISGLSVAGRVKWIDLGASSFQTWPDSEFVACLAKVGISLQVLPTSMATNRCDLRDRAPHLEKARDTFVAKIMEMQTLVVGHVLGRDT